MYTDTESDNSKNTEEKLYFLYPRPERLCNSARLPNRRFSSDSDSLSDGQIEKRKRNRGKRAPKPVLLAPLAFCPPLDAYEPLEASFRNSTPPPAVGIFWDIENCQVPKNKSATNVVQAIRQEFCKRYREAEFMVVCDVKKEVCQVIQDLHDAQVNLVHVQSTSKNAADEKLRQSLRRFAEIYQPPSAVVLISSDINFSADLSELRYRKKLHVILVHNVNVADALKLCADETYLYSSLMENVPRSTRKNLSYQNAELLVSNLPLNFDKYKVKQRLKLLSDNCGGRVCDLDPEKGTAILRFTSLDYANRAQKRLRDEDVYGSKIKVVVSTSPRGSPCHTFQSRKLRGTANYPLQSFQGSANGFSEQSILQHGQTSWRYSEPGQIPSIGVPEANGLYNFKSSKNSSFQETQWKPHNGAFAAFQNSSIENKSIANISKVSSKSPITFPEENLFCQQGGSPSSYSDNMPVDLIISNLDLSMDLKENTRILKNLLEQYVPVRNIHITNQADGGPIAIVKVNSLQDAQLIIAHLHHYKLGYKKLSISYVQNNIMDPQQLREMVVSLLQGVRGNQMHLFNFIELLKSRFHINVSVSEVNKLKDVCKISEDASGRIISLVSSVKMTSPSFYDRLSFAYCAEHCSNGSNNGWGEPENTQLPNISIPFPIFVTRVNDLLSSHLGTLPLLSFPICYEAEFGEPLPITETGVPLEHLVSCVKNVELKSAGPNNNIKYIKREIKKQHEDIIDEEAMLKQVSPSIASNIKLLCRELVDLLKKMDRCQILLNRFIPVYHHHFGRQCRVASFGYTKLIDLFESQVVSNVVQILGEGQKRAITLTHTTQVRRFTSDLCRVLKVSKQITTEEFPALFERVMARPFNPIEYGMCYLEDLLDELPENTVVINKTSEAVIISIPKREQTAQEIMLTKQFANDVVNLLRYSPQCTMYFNRYVPAYHHHFGHQCKVSDYGFAKLIELFEAIPDTVKIVELDGERLVTLTLPKALQVLGDQIVKLIKESAMSVPLYSLQYIYSKEYGYSLKPEAYECSDIIELVLKLSDYIQISDTRIGSFIVLNEIESEAFMKIRTWSLLLMPPYYMEVSQFFNKYKAVFHTKIVSKLEKMQDVCKLVEAGDLPVLKLQPFYILAAQLYQLILSNQDKVLFDQLESKYRQKFRKPLNPSEYSFRSLEDLLSELSFMIVIRGSKKRMSIHLNQQLQEYGVNLANETGKNGQEGPHFQWPPVPAFQNVSRIGSAAPPKPDTPPAAGMAIWSPTKAEPEVDLSIRMPPINFNVVENAMKLFSPSSCFASDNFNFALLPSINAPDPKELPMPDKLLDKNRDDSNDSGVINNSHVNSEIDMDLSGENGAKVNPQNDSKTPVQWK